MLGRWAWAERVSWSVDKCKSHVRRRFSELFGVVFGETRAIPSFGDTTYLVSCISGNNTSSASPDKYYILLEQSHLAAIIFGLHRGLVAHRAWLHTLPRWRPVFSLCVEPLWLAFTLSIHIPEDCFKESLPIFHYMYFPGRTSLGIRVFVLSVIALSPSAARILNYRLDLGVSIFVDSLTLDFPSFHP